MTFFTWSTTANNNDDADASINFAEGQAPSTVNNSARALMAAAAKYRNDTSGQINTGGSADAYTFTSQQTYTSLQDGITITFRASATNTGASTINVDSLGAKDLQAVDGTALGASALVSGSIYSATYDSGDDVWLLHRAPGGAIDTTDLADGAVTTAKIEDDAVTADKIDTTTVPTLATTQTFSGVNTFSSTSGIPARNTAKAFATFSVSSGDVLSFNASTQGYNVATIVRESQGVFTVTFTTALPTANYAVAGGGILEGGTSVLLVAADDKQTTGFTLRTPSVAGASDPDPAEFIVFGF